MIDKLRFVAHHHHDDLVLSVGYGPSMYGSGPGADTYELHMWRHDKTTGQDHVIKLDDRDGVVGWCDQEQVNQVMRLMHEDRELLAGCLAG